MKSRTAKHRARTSDMYGAFSNVLYPRPANGQMKYDFVFTRKGRWFYSSSHNDAALLAKTLGPPVEENGQCWRVVEVLTGNVVLSSR